MIQLMKKCSDKSGEPVAIRIGIHTGRVISGVVGIVRQQFSLFGAPFPSIFFCCHLFVLTHK